MSSVALVAAKGSPGVTTLAVAMVLARAERGAVLIEADTAGGDLALVHGVSQSPGLAELAARAKRPGPNTSDLLAPYIRALAGGALPVVPAPVDGQSVRAALSVLADRDELLRAGDAPQSLVFDLGRAEPDGPGWMWATACDRVLLVTRRDLTGLAHAVHLAEQLRESDARAALVLIDAGPYPSAEAEAAVGLPSAGIVPWNPKQARALADSAAIRAAATSRLVTAAGEVFDALEHQSMEVTAP